MWSYSIILHGVEKYYMAKEVISKNYLNFKQFSSYLILLIFCLIYYNISILARPISVGCRITIQRIKRKYQHYSEVQICLNQRSATSTCGSLAPAKWLSGFAKTWFSNVHLIGINLITWLHFSLYPYKFTWKMKRCQRFVAPHRSYMLEDEAKALLLRKVADPWSRYLP